MRRAINLGKAEMTGGPGLLTVTGTVTLGFHASLTPSRRVLCSGFLNRTLPDFPADPKLQDHLWFCTHEASKNRQTDLGQVTGPLSNSL